MAVRWSDERAEPGPEASGDEASPGGPSPVDWVRYVTGALWRGRRVAGGLFIGCVLVLVAYYRFKTPLYRVETRILAQKQQALPSIGRPTAQEDAPTRGVWDIVHRRENLLALIDAAELLKGPGSTKDSGGIREWLSTAFARTGTPANPEEERLKAMVTRLDKALLVTASEVSITISIDWPDAGQAYRLVEGALQNFLEARHLQEVTALDEAISLLQGRAAVLREQLDRTLEQARGDAARRGTGPPRAAAPAGPQSDETVQLRSMLEAKERAIIDVEEFRRRRLNELMAQLETQKAVYSEAHPVIMALRHDIEGLSKESPQVMALRDEARKLRAEYAARTGQEPRTNVGVQAAQASPDSTLVTESEPVRQARFRYQQMVERVSAAQMDLDAARAAFKYRYTVVWPAELPRTPVSPSAVKVLGLGTLASLVLAVLAALGLDIRAGKVRERWQLEHSLDLPVLGEIDRQG